MFNYLVFIFLFSSLLVGRVENSSDSLPPRITLHPNLQIAYKEGEPVELPCKAEGSPMPQFFWEKDGVRIELDDNDNDFIPQIDNGTLTIKKPSTASDGVYQCFAYNEFGTAVTVKSILKMAELKSFPSVQQPKIHKPKIGTSLTLTCNPPKSYPTGMVYWGENRSGAKLQPIENTKRVSLDYSGNLHFSNIIAGDALNNQSKQYLCAVFNSILRSTVQGDDQSIIPQLGQPKDRLPALMWSSPTKEVAIIGQEKKMKCIFSGYPTPEVIWSRIDSPLPSKVDLLSTDSEIRIPHITIDDAGQYRCSGQNSMGETPVDFDLSVESAPFWRRNQPPENVNTSEDEDAEFECNADGVPSPTITWSFNGRPWNEQTTNDPRIDVHGKRVKFLSVTKNDSQVLQCNASNVHGYIMTNVHLHVKAEPPSVLHGLSPVTKISKDQNTILLCQMQGSPKPIIEWTHGESLELVSGERFKLHPNGDLEVLSATVEDTDMYHCTGRNKFGNKTVHGQLIVREKTLITVPPLSQTVNVSSNIQLTCNATTDVNEQSSLSITWYKDDKLLNLSSDTEKPIHTVGGTLIINSTQVKDTGSYRCRAGNKIDYDEVTAQLIVKDRPSSPTNVHIKTCLTHSAEVSWTESKNNNDPILEYIVNYNTSFDAPGKYKFATSSTGIMAKVSPLQPWTNYTFHVVARNGIGSSDPSIQTHAYCSTPPAKPHQNPKPVCTVNGNPKEQELVIVWKPMPRSQHNGEDFHYVVSYKRVSKDESNHSDGAEVTVRVDDWRKSQRVFSKQGAFRKFEIFVWANNSIGMAPNRSAGAIYGHSTEGVPSVSPENFRIVDDTLNSTSVLFTWEPVDESEESINGFFKGYEVHFWKQDNPDVIRKEELVLYKPPVDCTESKSKRHVRGRRSSNPIELLTNKLWGGAKISSAVLVTNGLSTGNYSDIVEFETPEGVPDVVNSFNVSERGSHHLKVQWTPPSEINGILDDYEISYRALEGTDTQEHRMAILNLSQLSARLLKLSPNTTYMISIIARTATGGGEKKYIEEKTLPLSAPDKPLVEIRETGNDYIVVEWQSSINQPAWNPGSTFFLEYGKKGSPKQNMSRVECDHSLINLTGLTYGETYEVVVVAVNGINQTTPSDPISHTFGPHREPVLHTSGMDAWFIVLIVLIILLLLILIILCIIKQRRQGKYPVYEKEKKHGCDPGTCYEEPKFGEYNKSDAPLVPPSQGSIDSIEKPLDSETNSLAEYEDADPSKFNEDGSFIGLYGGEKQKASVDKTAPFATIV